MDFGLSADQRCLYDETLAAVTRHLPGSRRRETSADHFAPDEWATAGRLGLTGLCLPAENGGRGLGALDTALGLEAFGRGCADTGLVFAVAAHLLACAVPVRDFGREPIRDGMLGGLARGGLIAANAMTEEGAGSDVGRLATTAERDGGDYVLHGVKSFASNAPAADVFVTYAVTDPSAGFLGISAFAVPRELSGVVVGPPLRKMGLHGCPAGRVEFIRCRVPERYRLGEEGDGSAIFQHSMGWERACLFAAYVGLMDRQLRDCVEHARERRQFGHGIGEFQAVSHRLATMTQRLEGARLLLYRACWLLDQGQDATTAAAVSKVSVSEASVANSLDAVQIFGGAGYLSPAGIEQQLRDSVPSTIFSGTSEIQREIIAKGAGL